MRIFFPIKYHFEENDLSNSIKSNRRQIIQKGKKERNGLAEQKKRKNGVCAILIVAHFRSYRFFAPLAFERRFEQELEQTLIGKLLALSFFPIFDSSLSERPLFQNKKNLSGGVSAVDIC